MYGATAAGVTAAVAARNSGADVLLVGADRHVGGMVSGGLSWTDVGDPRVVGGLAKRFYAAVLGLDVHDAYGDRVVYIKHPARKHFIVCARRPEFRTHAPNFRFTLTLGSAEEVEAAHDRLATAADVGVTELRAVQTENRRTFFLVSDPDRNWWEIAATDSKAAAPA